VVLAPQPEKLPLTVRLGINGALAIRDVLLASSERRWRTSARRLTQAFRDVVDAIIAGGGMVGGLGERYTRVPPPMRCTTADGAAADGYLHGTKVAYGILVQSALLGQDDVLAQLVRRISALTCRPRWRRWRSISTTATSWTGSLPIPCARSSRFTIYR
jgi:uncharacterized oxidoreductase